MNKVKQIAVLVLALSCSGAADAGTRKPTCEPSAEANRRLVLSFYKQALIEKHPREAFENHVSADFIEHKPDAPNGGRDAVAGFLEGMIKQLPDAKWEILRTVAEKDLVFLHARFTPASGAPPYAIADLFRIEKCLIVEHWDVVGPPRDGQPNANSRF